MVNASAQNVRMSKSMSIKLAYLDLCPHAALWLQDPQVIEGLSWLATACRNTTM
jgi:hypothetical protein